MSIYQPINEKSEEDCSSSFFLMSNAEMLSQSANCASKHRYPHSIVWTPLPLISWFLPFIGHMGICQENGIIRDFQVIVI